MAPDDDRADIQEQERRAEAFVRYLVEQNEPNQMLQFEAGSSVIEGLDGAEAHEAVRTAQQLGWIEGELNERFGGCSLWTRLNPTVPGLRRIQAWPPSGREYVPGPWDESHWGHEARPVLERLRDDPEWGQAGVVLTMGPVGEEGRAWLALRVLHSAGYVDARVEATHVAGAALTLAGQQALLPPATAIAAVRIQLARGDVTRALIDLVEGVVSDYCDGLATMSKVDMSDKNGKPLAKLRQRIDRLEKEEALSGLEAAIFRAALEARNDISHVVTDDIDHGREIVGWLIDGVEMVINDS